VTPWLAIIGIGEEGLSGLTGAARALIAEAEILVGGERHLAMVPDGKAERLAWESPLSRTIERIIANRFRRVVVLATGDPLWYGVGVTLAKRVAPDEMTILPQPGAFSLAAARLCWPLADCVTLTLHGRPLDRLLLHLAPGARLLALAEDGSTPGAVAALLCREGWGESRMTVLEHLGGVRETLIEGSAAEWGGRRCADLNTIAVECRAGREARPRSRLAGLPDDAFLHDGQLTKREIRAATLAALAPLPGEMLWDIGAGSGSIAIEWLRSGKDMRAAAIERDAARCERIARNAAALGVPELEIVRAEAPAALEGLAPPNAAFIGGGLSAPGLFERVWQALLPGGRLVANAVTLEGEARLLAWQAARGGALVRLAIARAEPIGAQLGWRPLKPVTQLVAQKPR
jgi:precorrin-6Y C5,15-methyltransferase (decarboxylating)